MSTSGTRLANGDGEFLATDAWAAQSILGTLLARTLPTCCCKGVPEVAMN